MTQYDDRYPKLDQFLGGYFHQGWPADHVLANAPFDDIVRYFQEMNPTPTVRQTTRELEELLGLELSEDELKKIVVYDLGANVNPAGRGRTYRQWLETVLGILKKPTGR